MGLRRQQVSQADSAQELGADTIGDRVDHFTAVVGRVDVHAKWSAAKGAAHDVHDRLRDCRRVGVVRFAGDQALQNFPLEAGVGSLGIGTLASSIGWAATVREVMGSFGEGAGNEDGGLHAQRTSSPA